MNSAEFIKYISTPLSKEEMGLLYKAHNINYDKCDLFYDFILSLNRIVTSTFLGDDVISTESDIKNHFNWCINEVIKNFKYENIIFNETQSIEEYFYYFYIEIFYNESNKKDMLDKLDKLANLSFDYNRIKTRSDMDVLLELYRYFEKSLDFKTKKTK
jgi:hypothetical protein|tara:strand:- start:298 stop:771 length:474 start_codon:yes stop_codon:yes gene_type:complete